MKSVKNFENDILSEKYRVTKQTHLALEKQGCTITMIGDGIRDLNHHDLDHFNKAIASSQGRVLLDINAHGGMIDGSHVIQLGDDFLVPVRELLKSALAHAGNKRVDIISEACDSGQFCKDSQFLPDNAHYIGMSDHSVYPYYTNRLNIKLLSQATTLTAENLLTFSLINDPASSIGKGEPPHLCSQRSNHTLDELITIRSGIKFTAAEKSYISKKLTSHGVKLEQVSIAIKKLEENKIDKNLRLSNTELYSTAMAVVHLAQQYHEKSNPSMNESIMHNSSGYSLSLTSNKLDTILKDKNLVSEKSVQNPEQSNKHHLENRHSLALKIYQDLIHIRNHTLYNSYSKEVPKLLRIPFINFMAAMNKNHDPEHPVPAVRNSLIDIGIEELTLTSIGLSIGETPAAIALMASHLVESGLEHFASWEQIDKMPRTSQQERLAWSRMIEVRATAELLAWPSKATKILSHSIKSWIDDTFSKKNPEKDVTLSSLKFIPPLQLSSQLSSPLTYPEKKGLSDVGMPKTAWDIIPKQMNGMPQLSSLKSKSQISPL